MKTAKPEHPAETCLHPAPAPALRPRRRASADAMDRAARLFRAVADVSRLRVLELLEGNESCVSELAEVLGVGISTVSQQLKVLWTERLISRRRDGKHIFYRLADQHVQQLVRGVLDHVVETGRSESRDAE